MIARGCSKPKMETKSAITDIGKHWRRELFLTQLVYDLMEHHNQFHISQINVQNFFLVEGPTGEVYNCSSPRKQSLQQIASCLLFLQ